jgi:hypothetical protein
MLISNASRHARWEMAAQAGGGGPDPSTISAVSSWFRVAQGTITGSGYSSIPDVLNPASPAVQSTDAQRPPAATSSNGLPILACVNDALSVPIIAARNNATTWGFWGWLRRTGVANVGPFAVRALSGASVNRCDAQPQVAPGDASCFYWNAASTTARTGMASSVYALNAWAFVTYEFEGAALTEPDQALITLNTNIQVSSFSNIVGAPGAMPASLANPTGTIAVCAQQLNGTNPWVGNFGPNFGFLASKMAGATQGLLTPAARLALMNFEAPT